MFNNLNLKNQCLCVLEAIHFITTNNTKVSCVQTSKGGFLCVFGKGSCGRVLFAEFLKCGLLNLDGDKQKLLFISSFRKKLQQGNKIYILNFLQA